jgi:hypothetical protein
MLESYFSILFATYNSGHFRYSSTKQKCNKKNTVISLNRFTMLEIITNSHASITIVLTIVDTRPILWKIWVKCQKGGFQILCAKMIRKINTENPFLE